MEKGIYSYIFFCDLEESSFSCFHVIIKENKTELELRGLTLNGLITAQPTFHIVSSLGDVTFHSQCFSYSFWVALPPPSGIPQHDFFPFFFRAPLTYTEEELVSFSGSVLVKKMDKVGLLNTDSLKQATFSAPGLTYQSKRPWDPFGAKEQSLFYHSIEGNRSTQEMDHTSCHWLKRFASNCGITSK